MKLRLLSDFVDFYDFMFDRDGDVFRRMTTDGMTRRSMLLWFTNLGFKTPPHGVVRRLAVAYPKEEFVVYLDEKSHRGEGKSLLPAEVAEKLYPNHYASVRTGSRSESLRMLQIGKARWWMRYKSDDPWRSNVGDVKIEVIGRSDGYHPMILDPLYAIDYVTDMDARLAVDYNVAPGIHWSGIEDHIKPQEVVDLIKDGVLRMREEIHKQKESDPC